MYIAVSTGNCRLAVLAAISQTEAKLYEDAQRFEDECYNQLLAGYTHNHQRAASADDLNVMRNMAKSDREHAMESHSKKAELHHLNVMKAMLDWTKDAEVIIDDGDFSLLQDHLQEAEEPV